MAGESPDRSKQHGSSPEATSGNGAPVPGPTKAERDPRLAMAGEKARVDQATTVLSTRALNGGSADTAVKESEEPTDSEALEVSGAPEESASPASWVRSAEGDGKAEGEPGEEPEEEPEGESASEPDGESEAEPREESEAEPDEEPEPEPESEPGPEAAADDAADADEAEEEGEESPKAEEAPKFEEKGVTEEKGESESESEGAEGKDADAPKPPVDQPTAVFKAPRKPAVDQPTTMLKVGGTKSSDKPADKPAPSWSDKTNKGDKEGKEGEEGKPAAKAPAGPEAERASKFVPLKSLDEPKPAPDATAALPQVGPERTAQQPLPPKPPLDLLAELTNTPPPPDTPVRTVLRRIKIWTPLAVLLLIIFAIVQEVRPLPAPTLTLSAKDSYRFDGGNAALPWPSEGQGRIDVDGIGMMGSFGKQTPVAIGSVAKSMTAYIILKDHPLKPGQDGPTITVDALAQKEGGYSAQGESTLDTVKQGDKLTEQQALSAIMIPSANNIARLLARWDAGSEAAFIKRMNDTAKKLGMKNTTYTDPSGLKETTVSTAEDQVKLGHQLVRIPALMAITKLPSWKDPSGKTWPNYNRLVPYNGAIGIKTGTTTAAGGNLLFAATKEVGGETVTVVGAILGQHKGPSILDTVNGVSKTAMLAAQDALASAKILKKGDVVGYVDDQLGHHTPVVLTKDVSAVGWAGLTVKLSLAAAGVPHSAKAGTQVGMLTVGDGSGSAVKVPVVLQTDLAEPGFTDKLTRLG